MTTPDTTHECPGPLCVLRVDRDLLACPGHWKQVDKATQTLVYRAYRRGEMAEHVAAMKAAIAQMRPFQTGPGAAAVSGDRELGFAGLLAAGKTPQEAWQVIRDGLMADPGAMAVIAALTETEDGRASLEWSRAGWARHGLTPPWEDLEAGQ
jgi:hypothetical protein